VDPRLTGQSQIVAGLGLGHDEMAAAPQQAQAASKATRWQKRKRWMERGRQEWGQRERKGRGGIGLRLREGGGELWCKMLWW
jgi:hypothetical protein